MIGLGPSKGTIYDAISGRDVPLRTDPSYIKQYIRGWTVSGGNLKVNGKGAGTQFYAARSKNEDEIKRHLGEDIYFSPGTNIYAPFAATVTAVYKAGPGLATGVNITSSSDKRIRLRLIHLDDVKVSQGAVLKPGDFIGVTFKSQRFPGRDPSHLHLEAIVDDGVHEVSFKSKGNIQPLSVFDVKRLVVPDNTEPESDPNAELVTSPDGTRDNSVIFQANDKYGDPTVPFKDSDYMTPEERRKGVICSFHHINDLHLTLLADKFKDAPTPGDNKIYEANTSVNPRDRFIMALVDAEFNRRRFRSRRISSVGGPWNPYPIPGFPGLVMFSDRPVLGMVSSVSHEINIAGATASTHVSFSSPRYWDEGEVWYWLGGRENWSTSEDKVLSIAHFLYRNFPQWQNRHTIATNNALYREGKLERVDSNLDRFYKFLIGVPSIEYLSNHTFTKFSESNIQEYITDRNPGPFEINPETMSIREYNSLIAGRDSQGRFDRGTLAHRYFGPIKPGTDLVEKSERQVREAIEYTERYGITESELLKDFLNNTKFQTTINGVQREIYFGPTFSTEFDSDTEAYLNPIQAMLLDYMDEIESREVNIDDD